MSSNNFPVGGVPYPVSQASFSTSSPSNSPASSIDQIHVEKNVSRINSVETMKIAEMKGEDYTISDEQLVRAIEKAIKKIEGRMTSLEFTIHKETKQIAVKVLDKNTGEVIREVPPEKTLDFVAKLWEMAGILIDERR